MGNKKETTNWEIMRKPLETRGSYTFEAGHYELGGGQEDKSNWESKRKIILGKPRGKKINGEPRGKSNGEPRGKKEL